VKRSRLGAYLAAVCLAIAFAVSGCGGGGGGGSASTGVSASNIKASMPSTWDFVGGNVTVSADVVNSSQIKDIHAEITKPDSTTENVPMSPDPAGHGTYLGTYKAPPNVRTDGQSMVYNVQVVLTDKSNAVWKSNSTAFQVPAPMIPPAPQVD